MTAQTETADAYAHFIANMPVRLASFVSADLPQTITVEDEEHPFRKDYSPESLPWIEAFAISKLVSPAVAAKPENARFVDCLIRYLGEVWLRSIGGTWDADPSGKLFAGMPFIRPDSKEGDCAGEPVNLVDVIMSALTQQTGKVFVSALVETLRAGYGEDAPRRRCTGLTFGLPAGENLPEDEVQPLSGFLSLCEPQIARWCHTRKDPERFTFERKSLPFVLEELTEELSGPEAIGTTEELVEAGKLEFVEGAMCLVGEIIRRGAAGHWRMNTSTEGEEAGLPYLTFPPSEETIVPMLLLREALVRPEALTEAYDRVAKA